MSGPGIGALTTLFLRVGNTTFGGGDPTMAALQRELVYRKEWISEEQYGLAYSLARLTPGTNVLAFCAATGWLMRGVIGATAAVTAASLPSAVLALWLLMAYQRWQGNALVQAAAAYVMAAVVGMMAASALLLVLPRVRTGGAARCLVLTAGSVVLSYGYSVSPLLLLLLAAAVGLSWKESSPE
jgi:chromate transporter